MCTNPITIKNKGFRNDLLYSRKFITVKCGKCEQCIAQKRLELEKRASIEYQDTLKNGGFASFVTLTYKPQFEPLIWLKGEKHPQRTFNRKDVIDFFKRLNFLKPSFVDVKHFLTCEASVAGRHYIDDYGLPRTTVGIHHYHIILFYRPNKDYQSPSKKLDLSKQLVNLADYIHPSYDDPNHAKFGISSGLGTSEIISLKEYMLRLVNYCWGKFDDEGIRISIGRVDNIEILRDQSPEQCVSYVAKYATKSIAEYKDIDVSKIRSSCNCDKFDYCFPKTMISNGLGLGYLDEYSNMNVDSVIHSLFQGSIPITNEYGIPIPSYYKYRVKFYGLDNNGIDSLQYFRFNGQNYVIEPAQLVYTLVKGKPTFKPLFKTISLPTEQVGAHSDGSPIIRTILQPNDPALYPQGKKRIGLGSDSKPIYIDKPLPRSFLFQDSASNQVQLMQLRPIFNEPLTKTDTGHYFFTSLYSDLCSEMLGKICDVHFKRSQYFNNDLHFFSQHPYFHRISKSLVSDFFEFRTFDFSPFLKLTRDEQLEIVHNYLHHGHKIDPLQKAVYYADVISRFLSAFDSVTRAYLRDEEYKKNFSKMATQKPHMFRHVDQSCDSCLSYDDVPQLRYTTT